jgi:hypothetical protein
MRIPASIATAIALSLAACAVEEDDAELEQDEQAATVSRGFTTTMQVRVPAVIRWGGPVCPTGHTMTSLSFDVCLEPVQYSCTEYLCTNPVTGQQTRATMQSGVNPSCQQASMQTEACSNNVEIPTKALPTPRMLHEYNPVRFDKAWRDAPLLPAPK